MSNSLVPGGRANFYLQGGGDLALSTSAVKDNFGGNP